VITAGICEMTMLRSFVVLPAEFVALTVNLYVPIAVDVKLNNAISAGVPVIAPVVAFKLRPRGSVPFVIDQVIGVVPVAVSLWL